MSNGRHAICILGHNNFSVIRTLLMQLDAPEFDFYIHINAKIKVFPKQEWIDTVRQAGLYFVERKKIVYAEYSMMEGIKSLLSTASQKYHDYYHIILGADLLIKTKEEFLNFFEINKGKEFVGFSESYVIERVRYRNYFRDWRQKSRIKSLIYVKLRRFLIFLQKSMRIENRPNFEEVKKGGDTYSITHSAVIYLLQMEPKFKRFFYYSFAPTEFFAQTLLWNSDFRDSLYLPGENESLQSLREIDWKRGRPYVYRKEDFRMLMNSKGMFARKFDENVDMEIVKLIYSETCGRES